MSIISREEAKARLAGVALSHVAKRLVRIIFSLEKNDKDFYMIKIREPSYFFMIHLIFQKVMKY